MLLLLSRLTLAAASCLGGQLSRCVVPGAGCASWAWDCRGPCSATVDLSVGGGRARAFLAAADGRSCEALVPITELCSAQGAFSRCADGASFVGNGSAFAVAVFNVDALSPITLEGSVTIAPEKAGAPSSVAEATGLPPIVALAVVVCAACVGAAGCTALQAYGFRSGCSDRRSPFPPQDDASLVAGLVGAGGPPPGDPVGTPPDGEPLLARPPVGSRAAPGGPEAPPDSGAQDAA